MKIKCKRCGHEREYNGKKIEIAKKYPQFVGCTYCRTSIKLEVER